MVSVEHGGRLRAERTTGARRSPIDILESDESTDFLQWQARSVPRLRYARATGDPEETSGNGPVTQAFDRVFSASSSEVARAIYPKLCDISP